MSWELSIIYIHQLIWSTFRPCRALSTVAYLVPSTYLRSDLPSIKTGTEVCGILCHWETVGTYFKINTASFPFNNNSQGDIVRLSRIWHGMFHTVQSTGYVNNFSWAGPGYPAVTGQDTVTDLGAAGRGLLWNLSQLYHIMVLTINIKTRTTSGHLNLTMLYGSRQYGICFEMSF